MEVILDQFIIVRILNFLPTGLRRSICKSLQRPGEEDLTGLLTKLVNNLKWWQNLIRWNETTALVAAEIQRMITEVKMGGPLRRFYADSYGFLVSIRGCLTTKTRRRWIGERRHLIEFYLSPKRQTTLISIKNPQHYQQLCRSAEVLGFRVATLGYDRGSQIDICKYCHRRFLTDCYCHLKSPRPETCSCEAARAHSQCSFCRWTHSDLHYRLTRVNLFISKK
jgi:hypothetical protein